jgi:hypothetical protein
VPSGRFSSDWDAVSEVVVEIPKRPRAVIGLA